MGNQWSGYYTVNQQNGRNLHYWFIEADQPTEHVMLWFVDAFAYEYASFDSF